MLTFVLATIDMTISLRNYNKTRTYEVIFTLTDAVVFSVLTICLTACTAQLFMLLNKLRH